MRRKRGNKVSRQMQDYLEEILLQCAENKVARVSKIAKKLDVSLSTVSEAMKKLAEKGLIEHSTYGYISLTQTGREIADSIYSKHRLLKKYFIKALFLDEETAEKDACVIEHNISPKLLERIRQFVVFLDTCPQGTPTWLESFKKYLKTGKHTRNYADSLKPLAALKVNASGRVVKLAGETSIGKRILDLGITQGSVVKMVGTAPLGDPLNIKVGNTNIMIRRQDAEYIIVDTAV